MNQDGKILGNNFSRRNFLTGLAAAGTAATFGTTALTGRTLKETSNRNRKIELCLFSKHLQWLDYDEMAEAVKELGFDGVGLTVRRGGHVLPERAEDDLPKAAEAVKKAGTKIVKMVTNIFDPNDPNTEKVLRTASKLGITHYRLGYARYEEKKSIQEQLKNFKSQMHDLAAMNKEYKIYGGNHNHAGNYFGASIWDEWVVFSDIDSQWLGFQFDLAHAITEGSGGAWRYDTRLVAERIGMISVKTQAEWSDFEWRNYAEKTGERKWRFPTPAEFKFFFTLLKNSGFSGTISVHYEYPLGGADRGSRKLDGITREELFAAFRRNLSFLKRMLQETNLI